jgi:CDP-glucose 4,6-dehydratase
MNDAWEVTPGYWRDRHVAVTGATGFLGSHLTKILVELGANVVVLVRDDVPGTPVSAAWEGRVSVVSGQIEDQEVVERMLGEYEVRTAFHLAAQTQVFTANVNPVSTFESNIRGTWTVLEAVRRSPRIEQLLVASSDKAYGTQPRLPYTEDMPLLARNPYDVSKACADMLAFSYYDTFDLPVAVLRLGNLFGPGDTNWDRLVPGTIRSLLRGQRPVVRSDGTPTRDYIHVADGARSYLCVAESLATGRTAAGEAFNMSTETPVSVLDLTRAIARVMGQPEVEPDVRNQGAHEIPHQFLSSEKARTVLRWTPMFTLDEGLQDAVDWYREYLAVPASTAESRA